MEKNVIFFSVSISRGIIPLTLWCCIERGSVLFLFVYVYMHQVSAQKGLLSPKHLPFKSCSCRKACVCVFALCTVTCVYVLVRLLTFQLILFLSLTLFLLLTLSPGHRLINGYHSQLISYSSFGNYIRILTTQTKR